jgi:hypothetical protein
VTRKFANIPSLGQAATAKDIDGVIGNLSCKAGRLHLEESNLSGKVARLLLVGLEHVSNSV